MRLPIGSSVAKKRFASDWLMMATRGVPCVSRSVNARIHSPQLPNGAQKQTATNQQHQGKCDFTDYQQITYTLLPYTTIPFTACILERGVGVELRKVQGRGEAKNKTG